MKRPINTTMSSPVAQHSIQIFFFPKKRSFEPRKKEKVEKTFRFYVGNI